MKFAQLNVSGRNASTVRLGTAVLYFSYDALIAISHPDFGGFRDERYVKFSKTTSKHATILGCGEFETYLSGDFQAKVWAILRHCSPFEGA